MPGERDQIDAQLWSLIAQIPRGKCATYGDLGRALNPPLSGFLVGRRIRHLPEGSRVPWWRVVAQTGNLPIGKLSPKSQMEQADLLQKEGVPLIGDATVDLTRCRFRF